MRLHACTPTDKWFSTAPKPSKAALTPSRPNPNLSFHKSGSRFMERSSPFRGDGPPSFLSKDCTAPVRQPKAEARKPLWPHPAAFCLPIRRRFPFWTLLFPFCFLALKFLSMPYLPESLSVPKYLRRFPVEWHVRPEKKKKKKKKKVQRKEGSVEGWSATARRDPFCPAWIPRDRSAVRPKFVTKNRRLMSQHP